MSDVWNVNATCAVPSEAMTEVVSEIGKGRARPCQVRVEETSASDPPMNCRKRRNDVETRGLSLSWDEVWGKTCLLPRRHPAGKAA